MNHLKGILLCFAVLGFLAVSSSPALAFDCPNRFKSAQKAIDKVLEGMKGMMKMMPKKDMALVHSLVDDAKMMLAGARHNHAKPQGLYDHGRAIAKAETARGYAEAADIYHFKLMKKLKKMK
ncbi:MAG: hypothetical protein V3V62_10085 [bacterium]